MLRTDVIVIGGGPAGITFCRYLKKLKPDTTITMFRPEEYSMVYCAIPYALGGLFDTEKVYKKDVLVTDSGTELVRSRISKVDLDAQTVVDEQGEIYHYRTLFIATGADPVLPDVPGHEARNVCTVKTQQDMLALKAKMEHGAKRAVVVGAGAIGIEQAQAYQEKGLGVHLVDMAKHVLVNLADADMVKPIERVLTEKGIHLHLGSSVEGMRVCGDHVDQVILASGETIEIDPGTDFVCFAVGVKPNVDLFQDQGLGIDSDGIIVDAGMRTSVPNVLAAGDCCRFASGIDGMPTGGKLATNAVPMAKVAAHTAAGLEDAYPGFYNGAATCAYHLRIGGTGFSEEVTAGRGIETICGYGQTTHTFPMMPGAKELRVKIVVDADSRQIVGGQVVGPASVTDKVDTITLAIQQEMTVEQLAKLSYSAQPWQSFFPARNAIVQACEDAMWRKPLSVL